MKTNALIIVIAVFFGVSLPLVLALATLLVGYRKFA